MSYRIALQGVSGIRELPLDIADRKSRAVCRGHKTVVSRKGVIFSSKEAGAATNAAPCFAPIFGVYRENFTMSSYPKSRGTSYRAAKPRKRKFHGNRFTGSVVGARTLVGRRTRFSSLLADAFKTHGVVPDVVDSVPKGLLKVTYPGNLLVEIGEKLAPTQVKDKPTVKWDADSAAFYTLCMTDPDAPSRKEPTYREWHHWLVGNIPGDKVSKGEILSDYVGSGPPPKTGLHRYVFLVYKQPEKIHFDEKRLTNTSDEGRAKFAIRKFAAQHKLGEPIAGTMYQAEYDDYVPILYKQLGA